MGGIGTAALVYAHQLGTPAYGGDGCQHIIHARHEEDGEAQHEEDDQPAHIIGILPIEGGGRNELALHFPVALLVLYRCVVAHHLPQAAVDVVQPGRRT